MNLLIAYETLDRVIVFEKIKLNLILAPFLLLSNFLVSIIHEAELNSKLFANNDVMSSLFFLLLTKVFEQKLHTASKGKAFVDRIFDGEWLS